MDLGAVYAINMDGGGSSTMVMPFDYAALGTATNNYSIATIATDLHHRYDVINRPTCLDLPFPHCQRAIATVLCVSTNA